MDTDNTLQNIQDSFTYLPEEVKTFLYKGPYDEAMLKIVGEFSLNDEQKMLLGATILGHITETMEDEEQNSTLKLLGFDDTKLQVIQTRVAELILKPIMDYVESETPEEELENDNVSNIKAPSPAEALKNIQERLTKPSTVAPIIRDYSVTKIQDPLPKTDATQKPPTMDIYREIPEK